eukprot:32595_1
MSSHSAHSHFSHFYTHLSQVYATLNSFNLATNTIIRNRLGHMALSKYLNMFECGMNYGEEPKAIDHHDAIYPPLSLDHSNLIEVLKMRSKSLVQSTTFDESTLMHSVNLIQRVAVQRTNHFADQINTQPPITLRRINDDSYLFPQPKSMDFTYNIIWISFGVLAQARIIWRKYGAIYGYLSFVC